MQQTNASAGAGKREPHNCPTTTAKQQNNQQRGFAGGHPNYDEDHCGTDVLVFKFLDVSSFLMF
jgi:hypothetical protein